jgi:heme-degrading monooxygenase HmoA
MGNKADAYTSGDWTVKTGSEDEFIARWSEFIAGAEKVPGAQSFVLLRDYTNPRHFVSVGAWSNQAAIDTWRTSPGFGDLLGRVRALCDEEHNSNYTVAASPARVGA